MNKGHPKIKLDLGAKSLKQSQNKYMSAGANRCDLQGRTPTDGVRHADCSHRSWLGPPKLGRIRDFLDSRASDDPRGRSAGKGTRQALGVKLRSWDFLDCM